MLLNGNCISRRANLKLDYKTHNWNSLSCASCIIISLNDAGDKSMANPKGSSSEGIGDPGVEVIPVDIAVALGKWQQVEILDVVGAKQDRKKFIEDDVLPLSIQDATGFLEF